MHTSHRARPAIILGIVPVASAAPAGLLLRHRSR